MNSIDKIEELAHQSYILVYFRLFLNVIGNNLCLYFTKAMRIMFSIQSVKRLLFVC